MKKKFQKVQAIFVIYLFMTISSLVLSIRTFFRDNMNWKKFWGWFLIICSIILLILLGTMIIIPLWGPAIALLFMLMFFVGYDLIR